MTDKQVKAMTADIETPVFETTAFTTPKPLSEAKVAIVTSASLHHPDDHDFAPADTGFRVLSSARRDYVLGHWSPNFDTTGFAVDINPVFPIDRLDELAQQGVIGQVSDVHLSYAGNQFELSAIRMDSGPAGAKLLLDNDIDVVLLTPV
ncbi:MAG: glycine/sarcosine/betaine reductase selenoprotein B family protein [Acidimicrobiales bacterium]